MENLENNSHLIKTEGTENFRVTPQSLEVRCPECFKRYSVDLREASAERPHYKCTNCEQKFWFDRKMIDGGPVLGLPLEWLDSGLENENAQSVETLQDFKESTVIQLDCPNCQADYSPGDKECSACGVVFAKYQKAQWSSYVEASETLKVLWEKVILEYENEELHHQFIKACQKELNLEYASSKYGAIVHASPEDEIAQLMVQQIVAIASMPVEVPQNIEPMMVTRSLWGRLLWGTLFFASGSLIVTGYLVPPLRNLIGIGVALLFIGAGLKFGFRRF